MIGVAGRRQNSSEAFESVISTAAKNTGINGGTLRSRFKLTAGNQILKFATKDVVKKFAKSARTRTKMDVVMQAARGIEMKI